MHKHRVIQLSEPDGLDGPVLLLSGRVSLAEGENASWENITRVVKFDDPYYGEVNITRKMLQEMIANFDANVYGQDIAVDIAHMHSNGAAGFFRALEIQGGKLRGLVEWTPFGVEQVTKKGYRYFSAEYHPNYKNPETGKKHGTLLQGAALTTRPRIKFLDPIDPKKLPERVQLSLDGEDDGRPISVSPHFIQLLSDEVSSMWKELIDKLKNQLKAFKLSETLVLDMTTQFEAALKGITEEAQANLLLSAFTGIGEQVGKQLAESGSPESIQLDFSGLQPLVQGIGSGLSKDDVRALMQEQRDEEARKLAETEKKRKANVKLFTDVINGQEGFSDELKKQLCEGVEDLITADMTEAQIKSLSDNQIALGNRLSAQQELANRGFQFAGGPAGSVHIDIDTAGDGMKLQEQIDGMLQRTSVAANGRLKLVKLSEKGNRFLQDVLASFDQLNAARIHAESKMLAGGDTTTADTNLPVGLIRTVIKEALSDLNVLALVQTLTDPGAQGTTQIPYEQRDTSDVQNQGIVYEGQPIHRASVSQEMELAYILPMKLAFLISNEVMHFTRSSAINWDAYARNVESNARVMRELIAMRICNELQRSADAYGAVEVTNFVGVRVILLCPHPTG
jgi:hypothetical protein